MSNYIEFEDVECIKAADGAGLYLIEDEEYWIPWSQVEDGSLDTEGEVGTLSITEWIAEKNGLL